MNSKEYFQLEERSGAHNYDPLDVILTRGEGVWVYDIDGRRYLDCLSSYSGLIKDMFTRKFSQHYKSKPKN